MLLISIVVALGPIFVVDRYCILFFRFDKHVQMKMMSCVYYV